MNKTSFTFPLVYANKIDAGVTCLATHVAGGTVEFVLLKGYSGSLEQSDFAKQWKPEETYPVKRWCELALEAAVHKVATPSKQVLERLRRIAAKAAPYEPFRTQPERNPEMATSKAVASATKQLTSKPTAAAKPGAKTAAKAAPAKAAAPKPTAKAAPAKQPAVKATAKPAAKASAAKKPAGDVKHKVADDSHVKRGFLRDYVDEAKKMKEFTRDKLNAKFAGKEPEERLTRYFYYSTSNGIFTAA